MSTEHVKEEAEAARAALGKLTSKAKTRRTELNRKREGLQTERENLVAGARLAMQSIDDEDGRLHEEFGQLDGALNPREEEEDNDEQRELEEQRREAARLREENERLQREREAIERQASRLREEREEAERAAAAPAPQAETAPQPQHPEPIVPLREDDGNDHRPASTRSAWTLVSVLVIVLGALFGSWVGQDTYASLDSSELWEAFWTLLMVCTFGAAFGTAAAYVEIRIKRNQRRRRH